MGSFMCRKTALVFFSPGPFAAASRRMLALMSAFMLAGCFFVLTGCGPAMTRPPRDRAGLEKLRATEDEQTGEENRKILGRLRVSPGGGSGSEKGDALSFRPSSHQRASRNPEKTGFPLWRERQRRPFRTNEVRILRKAPEVSPGKFTVIVSSFFHSDPE